jgi:hypothetical protein
MPVDIVKTRFLRSNKLFKNCKNSEYKTCALLTGNPNFLAFWMLFGECWQMRSVHIHTIYNINIVYIFVFCRDSLPYGKASSPITCVLDLTR